jgi:hypothetical protein
VLSSRTTPTGVPSCRGDNHGLAPCSPASGQRLEQAGTAFAARGTATAEIREDDLVTGPRPHEAQAKGPKGLETPNGNSTAPRASTPKGTRLLRISAKGVHGGTMILYCQRPAWRASRKHIGLG